MAESHDENPGISGESVRPLVDMPPSVSEVEAPLSPPVERGAQVVNYMFQ